jgi:acetoin utilization deacetylase AcuC-like enzyme
MTTIYVYAPALGHTKLHHPENSARIAQLLPKLEQFDLLANLKALHPVPATWDQLRRIHTEGLIKYVEAVCRRGGGLLDQGDTYATVESYELARLAVGATCAAVDEIMNGRAQNGFALVRPPGHHAETDHAGGFCLFNNTAAAARQAQLEHGAQRVLVLDFDVHHGNGTQDIFFEDDSVLFISMHLFAPYFYPGIGGFHEVGTRQGRGYTVNIPFPPGVGDDGYLRALKEYIRPIVARFRPELMLISVGFDAHWQDPLAMAGLSLTGYGLMAQTLLKMANDVCDGRILFVLEGGYQHDVLTYGIANVFNALLDRDKILDPFGPMPETEHDVSELLDQLKKRNLPI